LIWSGTGGQYPESPHIYRIKDVYYLFIAEGGTEYGHMETVARSERPNGPYESCPRNPILTHRSKLSSIHAVGHADLVQTPEGDWWAVFLGIRPVGYPYHHHLGRETFLAPVEWMEDGWPKIGDNGQISELMPTKNLRLQPLEHPPARDHFDGTKLKSSWSFLRSSDRTNWSLNKRESCLSLQCMQVSLNDVGIPAFVGRRQQHFDCHVSAYMIFAPERDGEEAGITVYANERFHYEIAIMQILGQRKLIFRRRIGSLWKVENEKPWQSDVIVLSVKADKENYLFGYAIDEQEDICWFGRGECSMLATEVAGGFTGVMLGMYATGNGIESPSIAHFDWFQYRGNDKG